MKNNQFKLFLVSPFGRATMISVFYLLIFGLIFLFIGLDSSAIALVIGVLLGYFGWRALSSITPTVFLCMSYVGWIFYFLIKGFLSVLIGIFVAPFQISSMLTRAVTKTVEGIDNEQHQPPTN